VADQDAYFRVMDEALKHADGRAKGGEACVICGEPIPANAHWSQRDRHVCSARCNQLLRRRYGRGSKSIDPERVARAITVAGPRPNPRSGGPRVFRTLANPAPGQLPIEWEGYGPITGDLVERYGAVTGYVARDMPEGFVVQRAIIALCGPTAAFVAGVTSDDTFSNLVIGPHDIIDGVLYRAESNLFMVDGLACEWRKERVTDLHPENDEHFSWDCWAAYPVDAPQLTALHSPRYRAEMDRRRRVSNNATRHERRARSEATIEKFDPLEIYIRDEWMCQICGSEVDPETRYPDPMSASIDHTVPLSKGGDHTRQNTRLAHLRCNIAKRAELE